jgi:protein-S-isoprenylcysteine O-methyltransferase Ste14
MRNNTLDRSFMVKALVRFAILMLILPAILFIAAGTIHWLMGWLYTIVTIGVTAGSRVLMARTNPGLVNERAGQHSEEGVQDWDKKIVPIVGFLGPLVMLIVCGLDKRFVWSPEMPLGLQIGALIIVTLAAIWATWAMLANKFFSAIVRIQTERGHTVVDSGPYRFLRHPSYAASILADVAGPLALGSLWALVPGVLLACLIIYRTAREDAVLQKELAGYASYAQRVRYRLLPGLW